MSDRNEPEDGDPRCDHKYAKKSSQHCAVCGRSRMADQVKAMVANAPPLSQRQRDLIAAVFSDVDWNAIRRATELARTIERHALVRYPDECACGKSFDSRQDWAVHVAEDVVSMFEMAGDKAGSKGRAR